MKAKAGKTKRTKKYYKNLRENNTKNHNKKLMLGKTEK